MSTQTELAVALLASLSSSVSLSVSEFDFSTGECPCSSATVTTTSLRELSRLCSFSDPLFEVLSLSLFRTHRRRSWRSSRSFTNLSNPAPSSSTERNRACSTTAQTVIDTTVYIEALKPSQRTRTQTLKIVRMMFTCQRSRTLNRGYQSYIM